MLVFNAPGAFLLVGGRAYTNAVWLHFGPGDGNTVTYYVKRGHHPDIVLVSRSIVASSGENSAGTCQDSLVRFLRSNYRVVDTGQIFDVLAWRTG